MVHSFLGDDGSYKPKVRTYFIFSNLESLVTIHPNSTCKTTHGDYLVGASFKVGKRVVNAQSFEVIEKCGKFCPGIEAFFEACFILTLVHSIWFTLIPTFSRNGLKDTEVILNN